MKVVGMQVGSIGTNCYIAYSEATGQAAVIDPGGSADQILAVLRDRKLKVEYIINTHGHADHIMANTKIQQATGAPILIHEQDADMLGSASKNLSGWLDGGFSCGPAERLLKDGDIITIGDFSLTVIHTPGHTPGGICLLVGNILFSGDTLFAESIGRTDFPGGSHSQLISAIKNKLMLLDDSVTVLPGHGPETSIGWERKMNPFIQ